MSRRVYALLGVAAALAGLSGCVSVRQSHGYVLERGESEVNARIGLDTKESVLAKYGEPSMVGTFDENAWYYLASLDQTRAFFKPRAKSRDVVAFHFAEDGLVEKVDRFTIADGLKVNLASRETPTRGKDLSFWEQLLGNVGQLPAGGFGAEQAPGGPQQ
jgi:outer membrane protein assembly factor BamE (lipoprotein component of BamABCDE complex)